MSLSTPLFLIINSTTLSFRNILSCIHKIREMEDVLGEEIQVDPSLHFTPSMVKNLKKVIEIEYTKLEKMMEEYQK